MPQLFSKARDPISSYSHFFGAILSLFGLFVMLFQCIAKQNVPVGAFAAGVLFCISLIALYCASGIYHFVRCSAKKLLCLRKLDHAMIYVLIAGTYTPVLLHIMPGSRGVIFTTLIWIVAAIGILIKLCWMSAPRWLGTTLYVLMGWAIAIDFSAISTLPQTAVWLLAGGGIFYTIGAIIYMFKFPNFSKAFGFHELFHIFVILGSVSHYFMVLLFTV